jgi:hypothetical protein
MVICLVLLGEFQGGQPKPWKWHGVVMVATRITGRLVKDFWAPSLESLWVGHRQCWYFASETMSMSSTDQAICVGYFLHRLQCWLSGCDELRMQHEDKMKFSLPCYNFILINICSLSGSLQKKEKIFWCSYELDANIHSVAKYFVCDDREFSFLI